MCHCCVAIRLVDASGRSELAEGVVGSFDSTDSRGWSGRHVWAAGRDRDCRRGGRRIENAWVDGADVSTLCVLGTFCGSIIPGVRDHSHLENTMVACFSYPDAFTQSDMVSHCYQDGHKRTGQTTQTTKSLPVLLGYIRISPSVVVGSVAVTPAYIISFLALAEHLAGLICSIAYHGATPEKAAPQQYSLGMFAHFHFDQSQRSTVSSHPPFVLAYSWSDRLFRLLETRGAPSTMLIASRFRFIARE